MKLYKIDFTNAIGNHVVTVPTDSQFLLGISNGDSEAEVELLDGETELPPEEDKIGDYTVFNFETEGTPFKKYLVANINGQKPAIKYWDAHEYSLSYDSKTATAALIDGDVFATMHDASHANPPADSTLTLKIKDASGNYSTTIVYTFDVARMVSGLPASMWNAPEEIDEEIASAYPIPKKIRLKTSPNWNWGKVEFNYTGQTSSANWIATTLNADIQIPYQGTEEYTDRLNIVVKCQKMSVAYRDFEGDVPSGEALVDAILEDSSATSELKDKMQVNAPLQITAPNASTQTIVITNDNYADITNKVWKVGSDTTADNIKNIVLEINRTDFPSGNNYWHFIVSYKFPTDYDYMMYLSAMQGAFKIKDGDKIYTYTNIHGYQNPNGIVIFPQEDMGGQTLTFEFFWDETLAASENSKFMSSRLINATVDMTNYI